MKTLPEIKKYTHFKPTKKDEIEWQEIFEDYKNKADEIYQIDQTDREIDQMVYKLYGLTPEEIEIVEKS